MVSHGYGKTLDIDLATGSITRKEVDAEYARKYLGGVGFGMKMLWDEVGIDVDPYSPENIVVFANGPFTGTHVPCCGRTEITTKHPLNGSIGTGSTGGLWGAELKHAGYDVIVIRNKSEKPVYLCIEDDKVELRDAARYWGRDARETTDMFQQDLSPKVKVLSIGIGGENLVRFAHTLNDYYHVAGRSGAGGVLGSKKLKAIVVRGTGAPQPVRPDEFKELARQARERTREADAAFWRPGPASMEVFHKPGERPGLGRSDQLRYSIGKGAICYACAMNCYNDMGLVKEGKYAGLKESNVTRTMVIGVFGGQLGVDNLPAIWQCKNISQRLGMDYESIAGTLSLVLRLLDAGILTRADLDGVDLRRGNEDAIIEMMHKIARREGFGDVLADGSIIAAQRIGKGAEQFVSTIKGIEGGLNIPKPGAEGNWWFLGAMTNPRGDLTTSTHWSTAQATPNWPIENYDMFEEVKQKMYSMPPDKISSTWEGKALMLKWFEDLHSIDDALGMCFFPTHMRLSMGPDSLSKMYSAYTGFDTSPREFMQIGERLFNLFKAFPVRQGFTRKDDYTPKSSDSEATRARVNSFLDEYYELRGWDRATGVPTREKLHELGLDDIAGELRKTGRIP